MSTLHLQSRIEQLPMELKKEVEDFVDFLLEESKKEKPIKRPLGLAKGLIVISDDFDQPLADFKEYME